MAHRTLTEAEALTARTGLLAAAHMADMAMHNTSDPERRKVLDEARWEYLKLAERLA